MAEIKRWVVIECPTCGPRTRTEVLASAYQGGWCVGPGPDRVNQHKPVNYTVVGETEHR